MAKVTSIPEFCGRLVNKKDFDLIDEITESYALSRNELAHTICELLDWTRPNGNLKHQEAFAYLEKLDSMGLIKLPPLQTTANLKGKFSGSKRTKKCERGSEIVGSVRDILPITLTQLTSKDDREHWRELIDRHHYLGFKRPFGARLFYFIKGGETQGILGCIQVSSPAWSLEMRDTWLGWDATTRKQNLQHIVQNSRFLILPWIKVKGLASHSLSLLSKRVAADWKQRYAVEPVLLESFVDTTCFEGTCYKAANWICLGETKGRGRMDRHTKREKTIKTVWVYPLKRNFKKRLCA